MKKKKKKKIPRFAEWCCCGGLDSEVRRGDTRPELASYLQITAMGNLCSNTKAVVEKTEKEPQREANKTPQQKRYPYNWPAGAENVGYLTERQVKARMTTQTEQTLDLADGFKLRWAAISQRGYYPSVSFPC